MECNRDEAARAREIAEKKFMAKDIAGAKKFALKAQNLYPSLNGVSQMVATLNVIIAAEEIVNGERDWYGVLCASPSADEATVKKQYRKLALMLHPDKNKSVGAEGAFKFISEAWSVLSDKSKRMAYDQKRNLKTKFQRHPQPQSSSNGFYNFAKTATSNVRSQKSSVHARTVPPTPTPTHSSNPNTFWTSCSHCKMQYEYILVYLNRNLLCPNCHEPFLAVEKENPTNGTRPPSTKSSKQQQQTLHQTFQSYKYGPNASKIPEKGATTASPHNVDGFKNADLRWGAFSRTAGAASASASSTAAAQAANMVHQAYEKVRREREEKQAATRREEQRKVQFSKRNAHAKTTGNSNATIASETMLSRKHSLIFKEDRPEKKRRSITEDCFNGHVGNASERKTAVSDVQRKFSSTSAFEMERSNLIFGYPGQSAVLHRQFRTFFREPSNLDIQSMLLEKAKLLIWRKLDYWAHAEAVHMGGKENVKPNKNKKDGAKEKEMTSRNGVTPDDQKVGESHIPKVPGGDVSSDNSEVPDETYSIDVPDPDFHDFDKDRSEKCFEADQVWASYDDEDGMPRFYVLIRKILSLKPFKIRISFLNSKSNIEFSQLNWVARGFPKSCGEFRVGNCKTKDSINIFSHRVNCEKSQQGIMRIIPRKGEVWALYRNWSPHWDEHTPDDVVHKYDMVEVIDDYTEEQGVSVIPLSKVPNFKAVFRKQLDSDNVRKIPREEMFRFSHQVPSHLLTGKEAQGAPKGCYELDPAATPLELLQVTTEPKE